MRSCAPSFLARVTCAAAVSAFLIFGLIGCGDSAPPAGSVSDQPAEGKQATKSMEDYMNKQQKK